MQKLRADYHRSKLIHGARKATRFEHVTLAAILALVALGSYSSESAGTERHLRAPASSPLRGSIVTSDESAATRAEQGKVAIVMRPLNLKELTSDIFDDGVAEPVRTPGQSAVR